MPILEFLFDSMLTSLFRAKNAYKLKDSRSFGMFSGQIRGYLKGQEPAVFINEHTRVIC